MKIQMPDGSEMEIPVGICPKCFINSSGETQNEMPHIRDLPAKSHELDMQKIYNCPGCGHTQIVLVDNPAYDKSKASPVAYPKADKKGEFSQPLQ